MQIQHVLERFPLPTPPRQRLRVGLVGCGWIANDVYFPSIRFLQSHHWPIDIPAICEVDATRLSAAAKVFPKARAFARAEELFASGLCDAVMLLVPAAHCPPLVRQAVEAKLVVLVEKPVAEEPQTIEQLDAFVTAHRGRVQVAYNRRHQPLAEPFLREVAKSSPIHVNMRFYRAARCEESFYHSTAVHGMDFLQSAFGQLTVLESRRWPKIAPDKSLAGLWVRFAAQAGLTIDMDIRPSAGRVLETTEVISDRRTVFLAYQQNPSPHHGPELSTYESGKKTTIFHFAPEEKFDERTLYMQGFVAQIANFTRFAADPATAPLCSLKDAASVERLVRAIAALNQ